MLQRAGSRANLLWAVAGPLAAFVVAFTLALSGLLAPVDQALAEMRFRITDQPASGETLFVEIDASSLAEIGVWPWPRQVHAEVLDRLMQLGAAEVVFDIDFSTASTPEGDLAFERALERAGGYAYLAAFQQVAADGSVVLNVPLERFAAHAEPVLVNVDGDGTALLRSVPVQLRAAADIPSLALALVPDAQLWGANIVIDYGIDLNSIERVSVRQILSGNLDTALFANKQVVVGASAVELRDFFRVPRFGVIPGPLVQLAATETLKSGQQLNNLGLMPTLVGTLVALAVLVFVGRYLPVVRLAWAALAGVLSVEAGALLALHMVNVTLDTGAFHVFAMLLVLASLLRERALHWRQIFRQQALLAHLASHDAVTDALSRQALVHQLETHLKSGSGSVFLVELVRFDSTVAALGHEVGDAVAVQVTQRLERELGLRPARIANDVFAWAHSRRLLPEQQTALCRSASSVLDAPYAIKGHSIILDTRFGSSAASGEQLAPELLRQAEVALTEARETGVKAVAYAPEQSERVNKRRLQDLALRKAIERQEFFLLYQPQIDLRTGKPVGVEALVRWQSDTLGLVSPADFIPLAEETGLIVALGEWILLKACDQAMQWKWDGRLSINVSSAQFRLSDMVGTVQAALRQTGFPAHRLDIELTESLFVGNDKKVLSSLVALRQMGVQIALDDFGTGYSSLSYLSRLPIDKIKIDQSFIRPLPESHNEAIVETIVLMANRLGKSLVAEGVETAAQRDYLAGLGCQVGQGYLFGRPALPDKLGLEIPRTVAA